MADFKRNIHKEFMNMEPFWGKYEPLNNVSVPGIDAIQKYQLAKIQQFQNIRTQARDAQNARLNAVFKDGSINSLSSKYEEDENTQLDKAIENIVEILNGTYIGNKNKKQTEYNYQYLQQQLSLLQTALKDLNYAIVNSTNGGTPIPAYYLETVEKVMNACSIGSLDSKVLEEWFRRLNKFKGDLIEDIGVAWLSTLNIPDIKTINTGTLNYQGKKRERKGQIIQDLMTLAVSEEDLDIVTIEYKVFDSDKPITTTLREFLEAMERANGQEKQIILYDNGYDALLELSRLNVQAKAGLSQRPWNVNKSTQVSISEFGADGLTISAIRTFYLLHSLDQENRPAKDWVETYSSDYNALANYGLGTVLFKVLHLDEDGNDYLLTPQGFTTYTERMAYLMSKGTKRVGIKGKVSVDNSTMSNVYDVDFIGG